jgi:seryl-tRNA synthetase
MDLTRQIFTQALIENGLWIATDVPGVVGRSQVFEDIVSGFDRRIIEFARRDGAESIHFPPVVDREVVRRTEYMESFPELCGSIHHFRKDHADHRGLVERVEQSADWTPFLQPTELTLCPAACYPVYPICRGTLPDTGRQFTLSNYVFRSEPSDDPARLQSFRQREVVRIGSPEAVKEWRNVWKGRMLSILEDLDLPVSAVVASDPFFGRGGKLLGKNQIADERKFEFVVPITSTTAPTAIASLNLHDDKFGKAFEIQLPSGHLAHTACLGFGLERVALALLATHGFDVEDWPARVREQLA